MTKTLLYLLVGLLISCTQQKKNTELADTVKIIKPTDDKTNIADTTSGSEEDDCVFNNDYKGLTTGWLAELKIKHFIWRDDLKQALVPLGQDTIFFSKGGCNHSGLLVGLKLTNDSHSIADSTYWIKKALDLSIEYQMEHYQQMIKEGKIKKSDSGETKVWYEIEDDDLEDNLIYNGIEVSLDGHSKRVSISQYFN